MIWRLAICFSCAAALLCGAATVHGRIKLTGAGAKGEARDSRTTVVWLTPEGNEPVEPKRFPGKYEILQKNKTFQPPLLIAPVGAKVDFPNADPIFHNAFSNYNGQVFDIGLYPPQTSRSVRFSREGVVRVFCNIHSTMSAIIVVLRSPYYAQANGDSDFAIEQVPPGTYQMSVYTERATEQTLKALSRKVDVGTDNVELGNIAITDSGFLVMPHMNKYGKPYNAGPEASTYPGARQ